MAIYPVDSAIQLLINRGQEVIIKNSSLLFHFSGHNNDLLVLKKMERCIKLDKE